MLEQTKLLIKNVPGVSRMLARVRNRADPFTNTRDYWEQRYRGGGNSGPGSYNRLAHSKATFLNKFVADHNVLSVIELGCGDGSQLKLACYPSYIGIDISGTAVEMCRAIFAADNSKQFFQSDSAPVGITADLALSLDVVFHLVEDETFDAYMRKLVASATRFLIVYSSNTDQRCAAKHVRHRQFTRWIEHNKPEWKLDLTVKNLYPFVEANADSTSFADFYVFAREPWPQTQKYGVA